MYSDARHQGMRLDVYIVGQLDMSRQRVQSLIRGGYVLMDEQRVTQPSRILRISHTISVAMPQADAMDVTAEALPLDIIYQDDDILVINKASGMVVHPAAGHMRGTLVNALLYHCGDSLSGIGGVMRPGIVHRLDKETSGLMLVAKHDKAHQHLSAQLQDRSLSRIYDALCWSVMRPAQGVIDLPIARDVRHRKKMAVREGGKTAITHYETVALCHTNKGTAYASHLRCKLQTGRTHQIRVHLAHHRCGLIGDPVYGASTARRLSQYHDISSAQLSALRAFSRQALHASSITFIHPSTHEAMQFSTPIAEDMQLLYDRLCEKW